MKFEKCSKNIKEFKRNTRVSEKCERNPKKYLQSLREIPTWEILMNITWNSKETRHNFREI